jgi:hypothetical protein
MKAKRKSLIIKAHLEQKESHEVRLPDGSVINLYIGRKYGENNREINPTVADVVSVGEGVTNIELGDKIIVHHNLIMNEAAYIRKEGHFVWLGIPLTELIYAKIEEDGSLTPLDGTLLGERIVKPRVSELEFEDKTEPMKFKILKVPAGYEDVKEGDTILAYKLSDYEMVYHHNNRECRAIRISTSDVLGIYN